MNQSRIRPLAICLFRNKEWILVVEGHDHIKNEYFYRPVGGGIEFGEYSHQTIQRELREEIGAEVKDIRYLFTLENIFVYNGETGHEIVLVYDGEFADPKLYERKSLDGQEDNGLPFVAVWKSLSEFGPGRKILYPNGLWEQLQAGLQARGN